MQFGVARCSFGMTKLRASRLDWHIFRFTLKNDQVNVYLDEDPTPFISATITEADTVAHIRFGDNKKNQFSGSFYDWFIFDVSGAFAPGEGTPLPGILTGLPTTSVRDNLETGGILSVYPNPFTGNTRIGYEVKTNSMTRIDVIDMTGKLVNNLINEVQFPGKHEVIFNAEGLTSGMYYCRMRSGGLVSVTKIMIQ